MTSVRVLLVSLATLFLAVGSTVAAELSSLRDASSEPITVTKRADGTPTFVRGVWPAPQGSARASEAPREAARDFVARHAVDLRFDLTRTDLTPLATLRDDDGRTHVRLSQTVDGLRVFGAQMLLHYRADETTVYAVNGRWATALDVGTEARVDAGRALTAATAQMPTGRPERAPELVVVTDEVTSILPGEHLAWEVVLADPAIPARHLFLVDATGGKILADWNILTTARNRLTYDAGNTQTLPGALARSEGDGPVGDVDVDNAHDFAGATYDHFFTKYGRDSLDDAGAALLSTANYGVGFQNAFWNGIQMVYGDGFATLDVCAHELAHGVTENTSNLIYLGESGALNESFSDIFGVLVDDDDWLLGEDLPIGAIRSVEDPTLFGDPAHFADYLCTNLDNGGVHTNSGIQNKAAFLLATSTSRDVAGQVFYRALTFYLFPAATHPDARDAAINSAVDVYGAGSAEALATVASLDAVGLDASATSPNCSECIAKATALSPSGVAAPEDGADLLTLAYRVRDELLAASPEGRRLTEEYYRLSPRMVAAAARSPRLLGVAADLFDELRPGLVAMLEDRGERVRVRPRAVTLATELIDGLVETDPALATELDRLRLREVVDGASGKSYDEAWRALAAPRTPSLAAR